MAQMWRAEPWHRCGGQSMAQMWRAEPWHRCGGQSHGTDVEGRGQLAGAASLLPPCETQELNSGHEICQQVPVPTGPPRQPKVDFSQCCVQSPVFSHARQEHPSSWLVSSVWFVFTAVQSKLSSLAGACTGKPSVLGQLVTLSMASVAMPSALIPPNSDTRVTHSGKHRSH